MLDKLTNLIRDITDHPADPFPADARGLPQAVSTPIISLSPGERFELRAEIVRKQVGRRTLKMLAYNGSIPGPTLRVQQGSQVVVHFTNNMELETTVHWHGLRLEHRYDGVPEGEHQGMQPPVQPGETFTYHLRFPDAGLFWYHPHVREDYTQEHGMYGNIIVEPADPNYWAPVNRELTLVLDDILIRQGKVVPFSQSESNRTAAGRFGNVMLVNGETDYRLQAQRGETVRFYITNTANVRTFNVAIPGARMKLVGVDSGRVEQEQFVENLLISPSERLVVDVLFEQAGELPLEHRTPQNSYRLARVTVSDEPPPISYVADFNTSRRAAEFAPERERLAADLAREPDKVLALVGEMGGHGDMGSHLGDGIEWEDAMELHNRLTNPGNMQWKLVDRAGGQANHDIDWRFTLGDRVKIRIVNEAHADHPMQHPIHFHGQRFLVLARDGVPVANLGWKDTVLVRKGETVDILLECSNLGSWMAHCHIAEHVEGGMMLTFHVVEPGSEGSVPMAHHDHTSHRNH